MTVSAKERLLKARLALQTAQDKNNVRPFEVQGMGKYSSGLHYLDGEPWRVVEQVVPLLENDSWVAMVNVPNIGWESANQAGWALERTVVIRCSEEKGTTVTSLLLDGLDVVVLGTLPLSPRDQAKLAAKARQLDRLLFKCIPWSSVSTEQILPEKKGIRLHVG